MGFLDNLLKDASWIRLAVIAIVLPIVITYVKNALNDAKIRKLGLRAPIRPSYAPFGLDIVYGIVKALLVNRTLEYFQWCECILLRSMS